MSYSHPHLRRWLQKTAVVPFVVAAIALSLERRFMAIDIASNHFTTEDSRIDVVVSVAVLLGSVSVASALASLDKKHFWLIGLAVLDLIILGWAFLPFVGMNY